jgi:steroid delta-isomerase-like uncharacterized protein
MGESRDTVQRFYDEVANGGNLDALDGLIADDFVEHEQFPGLPPTKEGVRLLFAQSHAAFTSFHMEPEHWVEEGDMVVAWLRATGTHTGEFMSIPPSGNPIDFELVDLCRVRDGQIVEHWGVSDTLTMMQQLGAVPGPPG